MMRHWSKAMAAVVVLLPLSAATVAYADTTSGTTTTSVTANPTVKTKVDPQMRFVAAYQKNEATEASLLAQATPIQNSESTAYAAFVNSTAAQVGTLYTSEQALAGLNTSWQSVSKSHTTGTLANEKNNLTKRLRNLEKTTPKGKKASAKYRSDVAKIKREVRMISKDLNRLNALVKAARRLRLDVAGGDFNANVNRLRTTILGLQHDEIQVTKAWIASGKASVTGSVYGTNASNS